MINRNTLNIIASAIALFGLGYVLYHDYYQIDGSKTGELMVIAGLALSVVAQFAFPKNKSTQEGQNKG